MIDVSVIYLSTYKTWNCRTYKLGIYTNQDWFLLVSCSWGVNRCSSMIDSTKSKYTYTNIHLLVACAHSLQVEQLFEKSVANRLVLHRSKERLRIILQMWEFLCIVTHPQLGFSPVLDIYSILTHGTKSHWVVFSRNTRLDPSPVCRLWCFAVWLSVFLPYFLMITAQSPSE